MTKIIPFILLGCGWALSGWAAAADPLVPPSTEERRKQMHLETRISQAQLDFQRQVEERTRETMEKAARLEAEGKKDEAHELRRQTKKKMQAAIEEHRRGMQEKMQHAQRSLRDQRQAEAATRRGERTERAAGSGHPPELERRLHHVEQAMFHLREAGLVEPVEDLEHLADRLRRALRDQAPPRPDGGASPADRPPGPDARPAADELHALRRELEELKAVVQGLSKMRETEEKKPTPEKHH